jgi:cell division protein FtsB
MNRSSKRVFQTLFSALGACIVGYFIYLTLLGNQGWFAMLRAQHEVSVQETTLEKLQKERAELQHKTQLLRSNNLDPDLLEEKSRELLNYSKPNEIIILTPPSDPSKKAQTGP